MPKNPFDAGCYAVLVMNEISLLALFRTQRHPIRCIDSTLPDGTQIVAIERGTWPEGHWVIYVTHPSFPTTDRGAFLPEIVPVFRTIYHWEE